MAGEVAWLVEVTILHKKGEKNGVIIFFICLLLNICKIFSKVTIKSNFFLMKTNHKKN